MFILFSVDNRKKNADGNSQLAQASASPSDPNGKGQKARPLQGRPQLGWPDPGGHGTCQDSLPEDPWKWGPAGVRGQLRPGGQTTP